jgi:predicted DNA-binding protein
MSEQQIKDITVKVPSLMYQLLSEHAKKTNRTIKHILSKAIERYCGGK